LILTTHGCDKKQTWCKNSLVNNINARKKKRTSRTKKKSAVTKQAYQKMETAGIKNKEIMSDSKKDQTENLQSENAVSKLKELVGHNSICLFATFLTELPLQVRPMSTQEVDDEGNLWFLSSKSSNKNFEIGEDSKVQLFYSNTSNAEYLSVYGHAEIFDDRTRIAEIWSPIVKAWFKEGKQDPDLSVIKVTPEDISYWDTKSGRLVSLMKIMVSTVSGKIMDDGVEGKLEVHH
jgi:general stress protein 26